MPGLSLVAASGGHSSLQCAGLSLSRPLLLRSTGSRRAGSVVVAHGPSCSVACGIFPDQGSNPCPLHWQADSQPLHHQGSPHQLSICLLHSICHILEYFLFALLRDTCCFTKHTILYRRNYFSLPAMKAELYHFVSLKFYLFFFTNIFQIIFITGLLF